MVTGIEEWLPARDWPLYEVSSLGGIRNVLSKKILKPHKKRYSSVSLCRTVKKCLSEGITTKQLSSYFKVNKSVICAIKIGRTWKGL